MGFAELKRNVGELQEELPEEQKNQITYSKNFTISLSNYCVNQCGYCFYNYKVPKLSGEGNVVLLGDEQMETIIQQGIKYNCKEALLMSGESPDTFQEVKDALEERKCDDYLSFIQDICSYLLDLNILPHTNIGLLTFEQLKKLKPFNASMGLMLESSSIQLSKKGGVHEYSPSKRPELRLEHIRNAGRLKIPFTTGLLVGIGESEEDRIGDLLKIKQINDNYGHIQEVIIQNFVPKEGIPYQPEEIVTTDELLKIVGIARTIFKNEIAVQVPPNLIKGHEQKFIEMGVNDFGGISPFSLDYINPQHEWPQIDYLEQVCHSVGYNLTERLPIYKKYINNPEFCPENIKKTIDNII